MTESPAPSPFEAVYQRCLELIPNLEMQPGNAMAAVRLIQEWIDSGCDAQLDILPAINKKWCSIPGKVFSVRVFDEAVRRAHRERTDAASVEREKAEARLKSLRWKRDRGLFLSDRELAEITQHDQQYQPSA